MLRLDQAVAVLAQSSSSVVLDRNHATDGIDYEDEDDDEDEAWLRRRIDES